MPLFGRLPVKPLVSCALVLVMLLSVSSTVSAQAVVLNFPDVKQERTQWCWAATVKAILNYMGWRGITQCAVVSEGKNLSECPNLPGTVGEQMRALNAWRVDGDVRYAPLSFAELTEEIDTHKRPVKAGLHWPAGGGHAVAVVGFDNTGGEYVWYMDPADGVKHKATYTWFRGGTGTGFHHNWANSIYKIRNMELDGATPDGVLAAALDGLESLREDVRSQIGLFGLVAGDEKRLTLGTGRRIHMADQKSLQSATGSTRFSEVLVPTNSWHFPVMLEDEPRVHLVVALDLGGYRTVQYGGDASALGTALSTFREANGAEAEPILVKIGLAYYLLANPGGEETVVAVMHPEGALLTGGLHASQERPAAELLRHLMELQAHADGGAEAGLAWETPEGWSGSGDSSLVGTYLAVALAAVLCGAAAGFLMGRRLQGI